MLEAHTEVLGHGQNSEHPSGQRRWGRQAQMFRRTNSEVATAPLSASRVRGLRGSTGIWAGLVVISLGFVAIFYAWGRVAGLSNVALQMPYLVSGGLVGLALVIVGVTAVDVAVRRQDSLERRQQLAETSRVLAELRALIEADNERRV